MSSRTRTITTPVVPSSDQANSNSSSPLVCIEYPGKVNNVDRMVETLGGSDNVARVCQETNRRMELRFRPDDVFCKPTCGERVKQTAFLLKVKRMRRKRDSKKDGRQFKMKTEILGAVETTFKFSNLCDFQYLPVERSAEDGDAYKAVYRSAHFANRLVDTSWLELNRSQEEGGGGGQEQSTSKTVSFLPPAAFSRMDQPQDYQYRRFVCIRTV